MTTTAKPKRIQWGRPITVTKCDNRGRPVFIVSWYDEEGRRRRTSRASEKAAQEEADAIAERLRRGRPVEVTINQADRQVVERAKEILRPQGVALDHAMATLTCALEYVDIHTLVEAARYYKANRPSVGVPKTGKEILAEMLNTKADRSRHTVADLRRKLTPFVDAFQCPLFTVTTEHIESYIRCLNVGTRTKGNTLRVIGTLMNYARRKRYIPQNHPGIQEVEPFRFAPQEIEIFTPEEMRTLLRNAPTDLIAPLVLGAFSGLRTEEIKKLDWSEIHLDRGHIEIRAGKAKTRVRRLPRICDNLRQWLIPLRRPSGFVSAYRNHGNELLKLAKRCGINWKRNGLRHSFISYRVAECEDVAAVALHSGNSVKMIHQNYLKHVSEVEAAEWFSITPKALCERGKKELTAQESKKLLLVEADSVSVAGTDRKQALPAP